MDIQKIIERQVKLREIMQDRFGNEVYALATCIGLQENQNPDVLFKFSMATIATLVDTGHIILTKKID